MFHFPLTPRPLESSPWSNWDSFTCVLLLIRAMFTCPCLCMHTHCHSDTVPVVPVCASTFHENIQTDETVIALVIDSNDSSQAARHMAEIKLTDCTHPKLWKQDWTDRFTRTVCTGSPLNNPSTRENLFLFHIVVYSVRSTVVFCACCR